MRFCCASNDKQHVIIFSGNYQSPPNIFYADQEEPPEKVSPLTTLPKNSNSNMTRSISFLFALFLLLSTASAEKKAKYVFYFITDGTGVNTILGAEMYNAAKKGVIGREPFFMTQFPVVSMASTYSFDSGVTDSAASGTALATGVKTKNGAVGVKDDLTTPITSVAAWAKEAGMRVGVATSVPVNHATPAAFFAHNGKRSDYYGIGADMVSSGFDFYGGAEVKDHYDAKKHPGQPDIYDELRKNGYTLAFGVEDFKAKAGKAEKLVLLQDTLRLNPASGTFSIPYAIEAREGELRIEDILLCEIDFLMKDNDNGFFLMNEIGGKVDWACHAQDAATAFAEVAAVDRCIKIAYDFYLQHPDETLIVLTADHETGGLVLAEDNIYALNLKVLENQRVSMDGFSARLRAMKEKAGKNVTWEMAQQALKECYGFWDTVEITPDEEKMLKETYTRSFADGAQEVKNEYSANLALADLAKRIINKKALVSWRTKGHSAGLVPVFAIGCGSEAFQGFNDNALIPKKIAKAAGYTIPRQ